MNTAPFFVAVLLFPAVLALRIAGRVIAGQLALRGGFALSGDFGDAMTHLLLAETIRRNGRRIPSRSPEFLLSGPQDYPVFFHWLVALIPKSTVERFEWLFSPTIEAAHAVLVFVVSYCALSFTSAPAPICLATLLVVVWLLNPGLAMDMRRGGFLNERVFGFLFSNCYFMANVAWITTGHPGALAIAVLAGCVVAVSSKFGMQAMIFITPLAALLLGDGYLLVPLLLVLAAAPVMSRGYALTVWRGSIRHTRFYARYLIHVGDYVRSFSTQQFLEAISLLQQGSVRTGIYLVLSHPLVKTFTNNPAVWAAVITACFVGIPYTATAPIAIVGAAALVAIATSTDTLKYLGEGERYLEVALVPALLFIALAAQSESTSIFGGLAGYSALRLTQAWRQLALVRRVTHPTEAAADTRALLDWLVGQPAMTVYSVPGRLAFPIAYAAKQHRFVWWFTNTPERHRQADFERLFEGGSRYPYPAPQMVFARWDDFRADIAIFHRPTTSACKDAWGIDYDQVVGTLLFANTTYKVVSLTPNSGT